MTITNRMIVVRWRDEGGKTRTLLFEPTDLDLARNAPFYVKVAEKTPAMVQRLVYKEHGTVETHLKALGLRPEDVDYLTFDHLHTQDVRRLVGTRGPAADLSPDGPVPARFPEREARSSNDASSSCCATCIHSRRHGTSRARSPICAKARSR